MTRGSHFVRYFDTVSAEAVLMSSSLEIFNNPVTRGSDHLTNYDFAAGIDDFFDISTISITAPEETLATWLNVQLSLFVSGRKMWTSPIWFAPAAIAGSGAIWPRLGWNLDPTLCLNRCQHLTMHAVPTKADNDTPMGTLRIGLDGHLTRDTR